MSKSEPPVPSATSSKNALAKYQYVGTYESFSTPMGSSVSVLMSKGKKIKLASVDATNYINIDIQQGIPAMMIDGTYGINGNHKKSATGSDNLFVVREIEYLGGGRKSNLAHTRSWLPDFFEVNARGTGPLTRSELNIQFPDALTRYFDDDNLECFYQQVDIRAADMGDPQTMPPIRRVVLTNEKMRWNEMTDADKRLQLARYVTSMALGDC
ncbi:MAG: hypothetical protein AAF385_08015 [Pseudomonadota bacterium]